jgi:hypothetical protein
LSDLIETVGSTPTFSQISATSDLTIDVGGDIILDAAGDNWLFKKSGATLLNIQKDSDNVEFISSISDGDMKFRGNDGGSLINALTLDMSNAGRATFNSDVNIGGIDRFNLSGDAIELTIGTTTDTDNSGGGISFVHNSSSLNSYLLGQKQSFSIATYSSTPILFLTNNTEKWRIDSSGHFTGVSDSKIVQTIASGGGNFLEVTHSGNEAWSMAVQSGSGADDYLDIGINGGTRSVLIHETGGISFNGDTASANHLDDYEEGTWTPALVNGGSANTDGWYTKIGNVVIASYYIGFASLGSGAVKISGLPFSAGYSSNGTVGSAMARFYTGDNLASYLPPGTTLEFYNTQSSTWDIVLNSDFNNNSAQIHGTHIYKTAT